MKVPIFNLINYTSVMGKNYGDSEDVNFTDFSNLLKYMNSELMTQIKGLSALEVGNYSELEKYFSDKQLEDNVYFGDNQYSFGDYIVMVKLLMPSLWTCNYFYRNVGEGTHHGVDIILPKGYPLPAFLDGEIVRVMNWDGKRKNEGNCIVIKSDYKGEKIYLCYEHMDSINVENGQKVKQGDIVGLCGTTGNSTQYHLHFQVDNDSAPFHPYYCSSKSIPLISKYTMDPIEILKSYSGVDGYYFIDLPDDEYSPYVMDLYDKGIVKGFERKIYPDNHISRYEYVLIIFRLISLGYIDEENFSDSFDNKTFNDIGGIKDDEFKSALDYMVVRGIVKGSGNYFLPFEFLKGEETIAILGRMFYGLSDSNIGNRYDSYVDKFIEKGLIPQDWEYINQDIPRKDVFMVVSKMLNHNNIS